VELIRKFSCHHRIEKGRDSMARRLTRETVVFLHKNISLLSEEDETMSGKSKVTTDHDEISAGLRNAAAGLQLSKRRKRAASLAYFALIIPASAAKTRWKK